MTARRTYAKLILTAICIQVATGFECPGYGRFADDSSKGCHDYVYCAKTTDGRNLTLHFTCPEGTLFNPESSKCESEEVFKCIEDEEFKVIPLNTMTMSGAELNQTERETITSGVIKVEDAVLKPVDQKLNSTSGVATVIPGTVTIADAGLSEPVPGEPVTTVPNENVLVQPINPTKSIEAATEAPVVTATVIEVPNGMKENISNSIPENKINSVVSVLPQETIIATVTEVPNLVVNQSIPTNTSMANSTIGVIKNATILENKSSTFLTPLEITDVPLVEIPTIVINNTTFPTITAGDIRNNTVLEDKTIPTPIDSQPVVVISVTETPTINNNNTNLPLNISMINTTAVEVNNVTIFENITNPVLLTQQNTTNIPAIEVSAIIVNNTKLPFEIPIQDMNNKTTFGNNTSNVLLTSPETIGVNMNETSALIVNNTKPPFEIPIQNMNNITIVGNNASSVNTSPKTIDVNMNETSALIVNNTQPPFEIPTQNGIKQIDNSTTFENGNGTILLTSQETMRIPVINVSTLVVNNTKLAIENSIQNGNNTIFQNGTSSVLITSQESTDTPVTEIPTLVFNNTQLPFEIPVKNSTKDIDNSTIVGNATNNIFLTSQEISSVTINEIPTLIDNSTKLPFEVPTQDGNIRISNSIALENGTSTTLLTPQETVVIPLTEVQPLFDNNTELPLEIKMKNPKIEIGNSTILKNATSDILLRLKNKNLPMNSSTTFETVTLSENNTILTTESPLLLFPHESVSIETSMFPGVELIISEFTANDSVVDVNNKEIPKINESMSTSNQATKVTEATNVGVSLDTRFGVENATFPSGMNIEYEQKNDTKEFYESIQKFLDDIPPKPKEVASTTGNTTKVTDAGSSFETSNPFNFPIVNATKSLNEIINSTSATLPIAMNNSEFSTTIPEFSKIPDKLSIADIDTFLMTEDELKAFAQLASGPTKRLETIIEEEEPPTTESFQTVTDSTGAVFKIPQIPKLKNNISTNIDKIETLISNNKILDSKISDQLEISIVDATEKSQPLINNTIIETQLITSSRPISNKNISEETVMVIGGAKEIETISVNPLSVVNATNIILPAIETNKQKHITAGVETDSKISNTTSTEIVTPLDSTTKIENIENGISKFETTAVTDISIMETGRTQLPESTSMIKSDISTTFSETTITLPDTTIFVHETIPSIPEIPLEMTTAPTLIETTVESTTGPIEITMGPTIPDSTLETTSSLPVTTSGTTVFTETTIGSTTPFPESTLEQTTILPSTISELSTSLPDTTLESTTSQPEATMASTTVSSETTIGSTTEYPGTTLESTTASPETTIGSTTEYPGTTLESTTVSPETTIVSTTEYPGTTLESTTASPETTIGSTTEYPGTTLESTTVSPETTIVSTTEYPGTTLESTTFSPETTIVSTTEYPGTTILSTTMNPETTIKLTTVFPETTVESTTAFPESTLITTTNIFTTTLESTTEVTSTPMETTTIIPEIKTELTTTLPDTTLETTTVLIETTPGSTSALPDTTLESTTSIPETTTTLTTTTSNTTPEPTTSSNKTTEVSTPDVETTTVIAENITSITSEGNSIAPETTTQITITETTTQELSTTLLPSSTLSMTTDTTTKLPESTTEIFTETTQYTTVPYETTTETGTPTAITTDKTTTDITTETTTEIDTTPTSIPTSPSINIPSVFVCQTTGRYPDSSDDSCKKYVLCIKMLSGSYVQFKYSCLNDSFFNPVTQQCSKNYICPTSTITQEDIIQSDIMEPMFSCTSIGRHPDPSVSDCSGYILCINAPSGEFIQYQYKCLPPYLFNPYSRECSLNFECSPWIPIDPTINSYPHLTIPSTTTISPIVPTSEFVCNAVGRFPDDQISNCKGYIVCSRLPNGSYLKSNYLCFGKAKFDPYSKTCNENYICQNVIESIQIAEALDSPTSITTQPSTTSTTIRVLKDPEQFTCTSTGRFLNSAIPDCAGYVLCLYNPDRGFTQFQFLCQSPSKFDPILRQCSVTYNCANNRMMSMVPMQSFYMMPMSSSSYPLQSPLYSNPISMIRTTSPFICKTMGRFEDPGVPNCGGYILCVRSPDGTFKQYQYSCSENARFNPTSMLCSTSYICPYA